MVESESSQNFNKLRLDTLSIPHYVIKKGRPHGNRHGKTEALKEHFIAHNTRKRCIKKGFEGIHDRFQKDFKFRDSELRIDRTEKICIQMDEVAQKDCSYHMTQAEYFRYRKNWWICLNNSGKTGPLRDRPDFNDALTTLNRLHQESGEQQLRPVPFWKCQKWHQSSSSSSSWWQWSLNTSGRNAPMKLRSDFREAVTKMHRTDSFLVVSEMASVVFFIQHVMVAVERSLVELIIHQSQAHLDSRNEWHHRTGRPFEDAFS